MTRDSFVIFQDETAWNRTVQDGIKSFFEMEENRDKLSVLSVAGLNTALAQYTEGNHTDAFENLVEYEKIFLAFQWIFTINQSILSQI